MKETNFKNIILESLERFVGIKKDGDFPIKVVHDNKINGYHVEIARSDKKDRMAYACLSDDFLNDNKNFEDFLEKIGISLVEQFSENLDQNRDFMEKRTKSLEESVNYHYNVLSQIKSFKRNIELSSDYYIKRKLAEGTINDIAEKLTNNKIEYIVNFHNKETEGCYWDIKAVQKDNSKILYKIIIAGDMLEENSDKINQVVKELFIDELNRNLAVQNLKRIRKDRENSVEVIDVILEAYKIINKM